jgi:lysophospholipase L1-like esterase
MIRPALRHRLEWDVLESRLCPSDSGATSIIPDERTDDYAVERHLYDLGQVASGNDNIVFLGDSITDYFYGASGSSIWQSRLASIGAANFGVAGDTAENLLWRIENGELSGDPKVAVVEIGTNDLGLGYSVDYTAAAIEAVVEEIHALSPNTLVVLMGLFPRGATADDFLRIEAEEVNDLLADWSATRPGVDFLDIDSELTAADGSITADFLPDDLHPNARGYEVWANAIEPVVLDLLGTTYSAWEGSGTTGSASTAAPSSATTSTGSEVPQVTNSASATPAASSNSGPSPGPTLALLPAADGFATPPSSPSDGQAHESTKVEVPTEDVSIDLNPIAQSIPDKPTDALDFTDDVSSGLA